MGHIFFILRIARWFTTHRRGRHELRHAAGQGERSADALRQLMREQIALAPLAEVDYVEVVDADSLAPVETLEKEGPSGGRYLAALAVRFGGTRLIDNATLRVA